SATDPTNGGINTTRTATWQVTDATTGTASAPQTETIDLSSTYAPTGMAVRATAPEALQGGSAVALLSGVATITDPSTTLTGATIRIATAGGSAVAGDQLFVAGVQSGTVGGGAVTVGWSAATSTLTLSGTASVATYQTLLGQVMYQDTGTDAASGAHPVRTV